MRYKKDVVFASVLSLFFVTAAFSADKYEIDAVHTSVGFSVRHLVISNVKGKFNDVSGIIMYDDSDLNKSSVSVTIKTASIDSDNQDRDGHLKSGDFFNVEKYPEITFKSKRIEKKDDGYVAIGDLTIRGVTKEVNLTFTVLGPIKDPWGNMKIGVEGSLTIDRQDYGVSWSKTMDNGGLVVGNEVKMEFSVEAVKAK